MVIDPPGSSAALAPPSAALAPPSTARRWAPWAALAGALLLVALWWGLRSSPTADLRGVRLGFSAADTRELFQTASPGVWSSEANPEPRLRWEARQGGPVRQAIFEFHQGMLVAIRLQVAAETPEAQGPALEVTPARVLTRKKEPSGGVSVTALSRTCPAHATEVAQLLRGGSLAQGVVGPGRCQKMSTAGGRSCDRGPWEMAGSQA